MRPTLLVLAAGMGTRYGGLKQIDPVGPYGQTLIDYCIYDAVRVGFGKVVFVIRHSFENAFREVVSRKFESSVETAYAFQELQACLDEFPLPVGREKPWGTGHAILVSRDVIREPFAVVNADDYYGFDSLGTIAAFLTSDVSPREYAMIGYILKNTLSECGTVARGVADCDEHLLLRGIAERKGIQRTDGGIRYCDVDRGPCVLGGDEIVSMNLWGFHPSVFAHLAARFAQFLREHGHESNSELYIPSVIDELVTRGLVRVRVRTTHDNWFGVTYRDDASTARQSVRELTDRGIYPEKLWG